MTPIALIRHAPTAWNEDGRIQGRADPPLSRAGRAALRGWRLPPDLQDFAWAASPLRRARETARALGAPKDTAIEPRLVEMSWGEWEGWTLDALRARHDGTMAANEARGLDFRPPGGESPREVQARVAEWLQERAVDRRPVVAVTHNGVIRAVLALATGWDMRSKPPAKLTVPAAHLFAIEGDGRPAILRLNLPLGSGE